MKNILCFGDSNTWGWDTDTFNPAISNSQRMPFEVRWPGVAQKILGPDYRIIEDAQNGRTIVSNDKFFPNRVGLDQLETSIDAHAPLDLIILALGCNELKQQFALGVGMIAYGLERLILTAKQSIYGYPVPQIIVISPTPTRPDVETGLFGFMFDSKSYEKSCGLPSAYKLIADRYRCGFIDGSLLGLTLHDVDKIHYTRADHAKVGQAAAEKIRETLG
jgi:lysophospholipase L1-like esterase